MFSKEEASRLRKEFWTAYGRYMTGHCSVRGPKIKWLNYKTGVKDIFFRLEMDSKTAKVCIDIQHDDEGIRNLFFDQFEELKTLLENETQVNWTWDRDYQIESGKKISRIYTEKNGVNIYLKECWGECFRFFEGIMVPIDELWDNAMPVFEDLAT